MYLVLLFLMFLFCIALSTLEKQSKERDNAISRRLKRLELERGKLYENRKH